MVRNDMAMQTRCVHCGVEQYAPIVYAISRGQEPCVWCGEKSVEMTVAEYHKQMAVLKDRQRRDAKIVSELP